MTGNIYLFHFGKRKSLVVVGRQLNVQNIRLIASQQWADPTKDSDVALKKKKKKRKCDQLIHIWSLEHLTLCKSTQYNGCIRNQILPLYAKVK